MACLFACREGGVHKASGLKNYAAYVALSGGSTAKVIRPNTFVSKVGRLLHMLPAQQHVMFDISCKTKGAQVHVCVACLMHYPGYVSW
jgi:hypothetical protein